MVCPRAKSGTPRSDNRAPRAVTASAVSARSSEASAGSETLPANSFEPRAGSDACFVLPIPATQFGKSVRTRLVRLPSIAYFAAKGWGRSSLKHARSLLSGIFTYAKNLGVPDGVNPVQGTIIPRKAAASAETHATTPDEVVATLDVLKRERQPCTGLDAVITELSRALIERL